jgi:Radical SAM superfamily.
VTFKGAGLATRGADTTSRLTILRRHLTAFTRHLTPRRLINFLHVEAERLLGREVAGSLPYLLKIEPSNICNLRCKHCYDGRPQPEDTNERAYGRMTLAQFTELIDQIGDTLLKINLYGFGEPFLFPETLDMIRVAAARNIGVGVSSNMHFSDEDLPRRIVESGLEVLIVSCHGITPQTHARFMHGGDFDCALGNIRAVADYKRRTGARYPIMDWQYCVTGFNEHEISRAQQLADDIGVDQIRFIRPYLPDDPGEEWESERFPRIGKKEEAEGAGCSWLYRAAYINWDGGVLPCCRDVRTVANDFGNMNNTPFRALWNNDRFRAARRLAAGKTDHDADAILCTRCPATMGNRKKDG